MAYFRPSEAIDCLKLAPKLREQDKNEVMASHGLEPVTALHLSFKLSNKSYSIIHDDEVIGMFGYGPGDSDIVAVPWLLASDKLKEISREFLPQSKTWVEEVNKDFPILVNYVDARNTVAIRWLKFLGFKFIRKIDKFGLGQIPFYEFVRVEN